MNSSSNTTRGIFSGAPKLDPAIRSELQGHVINLSLGQFSSSGDFATEASDVEAIFAEHLPKWASDQAIDKTLPIMLYAHGGLTNEAWGLHSAAKQLRFWKQNGVYPIFFVWETGFLETIEQQIGREESATRERGFGSLFDFSDRAVEAVVRNAWVPKIWAGMKESARLTFAENGAGTQVLSLLNGFCKRAEFENRIHLHAVGHSAGSIFHAHLVKGAKDLGMPKFDSCHYLAPAITNQLFQSTLMPLVGKSANDQVEHLTVYTMKKQLELDDSVAKVYRKSLLYLIYYALEPQRKTPILGLETSIRDSADLKRFFGIATSSSADAEVVWSISPTGAPTNSRSTSTTHGGFDDDGATMESVARRILKVQDSEAISPYPNTSERNVASSSSPASSAFSPESFAASVVQQRASGTKRAICIGINKYATRPLDGCVNDSNRWATFFTQQGFETTSLLDEKATRKTITEGIRQLITKSQAGDTLTIQFAGHGTQVPDDNNDEIESKDEALVPYDYMSDGLIVDDDLAELCEKIPEGVKTLFFMDCCHSGSNSRFTFFGDRESMPQGKSRFLPATREMIQVHRKSREQNARSFTQKNPYKGRAEILFAACRPEELAWESHGQGDFTRLAIPILESNPQISGEAFLSKLIAEFGDNPRQTPGLWCDSSLRGQQIMGPPPASSGSQRVSEDSRNARIQELLKQVIELLN